MFICQPSLVLPPKRLTFCRNFFLTSNMPIFLSVKQGEGIYRPCQLHLQESSEPQKGPPE